MINEKIKNYTIAKAPNYYGLADEVKRYMEFGWKPWGQPLIQNDEFHQALVKFEENEI
jgi:hypothetical protein